MYFEAEVSAFIRLELSPFVQLEDFLPGNVWLDVSCSVFFSIFFHAVIFLVVAFFSCCYLDKFVLLIALHGFKFITLAIFHT